MPAHVIDDIAIAPPSALVGAAQWIAQTVTARLGAVVEYEFQRLHNRPDLPRLSLYTDSSTATQIEQLIGGASQPRALGLHPVDADAIRIPSALGADPAWTAFVKRAELTAREAGFADLVAGAIAGAIDELADNVMQHSQAINTGIAAFSRVNGRFEYVVADAGIGMLASLRNAPEFRSLRDDLEALPLAITPGVSRRGRGTGYGYGYRAVFGPLRAASGSVRLRSGRAVLHVAGYGVSPDQATCSQRPQHQGVVVAVECAPQ